MPDTVSSAHVLLEDGELSREAWAVLAGQGLGALDKKAGVFDDTPPSDVRVEHVDAYRAAYCAMNPDYAIE